MPYVALLNHTTVSIEGLEYYPDDWSAHIRYEGYRIEALQRSADSIRQVATAYKGASAPSTPAYRAWVAPPPPWTHIEYYRTDTGQTVREEHDQTGIRYAGLEIHTRPGMVPLITNLRLIRV